MNLRPLVLVGVLGLAPLAWSQTYTETRVEAKPVIITGEVLRFEPGKLVVIRNAEGKEVTYTLLPTVTVAPEVQVGRTVQVFTEPRSDGTVVVEKITTSVTAEGDVQRKTEVTRTTPSGQTTETTTTTTNPVTGEVVRYEPSKTIVIRSGGKEVTYVLTPQVSVPADVRVGRAVTLYTEPGPDGTTMVKRVTTTSVTPEGQVKRTTEETRTKPSGDTSRTTTTTITGKVDAYEPGKSITVIDSSGARVTYLLGAGSTLPAEQVMKRQVTIYVVPGAKERPEQVVYEIERDGDTIKIKAKKQ